MMLRAVDAPEDETRNVGVFANTGGWFGQAPKMLVSMNWLRNLPWGSYPLMRVW
jgi:hypothetical protein